MAEASLQGTDPSGEPDVLHYLFEFRVRGCHLAEPKIASQRCVEQNRVRRGVAHVFPEALDFNFPHVMASNGNRSRVCIVQTRQKLCQCALASAVLSYDGHVLAGTNVQLRNRQQPPISRISEAKVSKLDRPWGVLRKLDSGRTVRDRRLQCQYSPHFSDARKRLL